MRLIAPSHGRPAGQVLLEFVLALIGVVVFVYVIIGVWTWLNQMIVDRQVNPDAKQGFQASRSIAGQHTTTQANRVINFERQPLQLMGNTLGDPQARAMSLAEHEKSCPGNAAAEDNYRRAMQDNVEVKRLNAQGGPIDLLEIRIEFNLNRMCHSDSAPSKVEPIGTERCDDPKDTNPDCIRSVKINDVSSELSQLRTSCLGLRNDALRQDGNWIRCAPYWYERARRAYHDDDDDAGDRYSGYGSCCMYNTNLLETHIESLGDQLGALEDYGAALERHRDWLFQQGDCACPLTRGEKAVRDPSCDDPKPSVPPPPSEIIPADPATRPC